MSHHHLVNNVLFVLLVPTVVASCGGARDTQTTPATTMPVVDRTVPGSAPPTTDLAIASAVTAPVVDGSGGRGQPLRQGVPMDSGAVYSLDQVAGSTIDIRITDPVGGRFGLMFPGMAEIGDAEDGSKQLVDVFELSSTSVFTDPTIDLSKVARALAPGSIEDAPADYLGWIGASPGVTAGPVTDTVFAGLAAKTMTYVSGNVDGAPTCVANAPACLARITNPRAGFAYTDYVGATVTLYQIDVGGTGLVIAVSESPGAAELAATITITAADAPPGAEALNWTGPLASDVTYFWNGSSIGTYEFSGDPAVKVGPMSQPGGWFADMYAVENEPCMSISDGTQDRVWVSDPGGGAHATGPVTADFMDVVASNDSLEIVNPRTPTKVGDITATAIDVKYTGKFAVMLIGGGIPVPAGPTVRIVAIPRAGGAPDVVMAELGSPCEAIFKSLTLVPAT